MNDLMTKSFLSYVELKKQALKDLESGFSVPGVDPTTGVLTHAEGENLSQFFKETEAIQSEMEDIASLLLDLRQLNEETKSVHSAKVLRGVRDRMDSDMTTILRKAKTVKSNLEALDRSNAANRGLSSGFGAGSTVDRTRTSVTNGLRSKLRDTMNGFQSLREQIAAEHKEDLRRRYFNATGEVATDDVVERFQLMKGDKGEGDIEMLERDKAVSEIQRSLMNLHQVFLDMAVMVEAQEEQLNVIEENVVRAKDYISGGTDSLVAARALRKPNRKCFWCLFVFAVILVLLFLIPILAR